MAKVLYTAEAEVTGGRGAGHGHTSDGQLDVELRAPEEMGGQGGGTNPEQLFAIGFAACFESALGAVGRRRKVVADDAVIESKVKLFTTEDRAFNLAVDMDVTLPSIDDPTEALETVRAAHGVCPYSRATRGNIEVAFTVNGQAMD
jgi:osmotically inducible protein OsmC